MSVEQNDPVLASEQATTSDHDTSEMTKSSKRGLGGFNLTISQKLICIVSLIIILLVAVAGTGIYQMQNIGKEIEEIAEQDMPLTEAITAITIHQLEQAINFERLLRYGEEIKDDPLAHEKFEKAFEHFEELTKKVDLEILEAEKIARRAIDHAATPASRQEFEHVLTALLKIETEHADYEKHVEHVAELIEAGEIKKAHDAGEKIEIEEDALDLELESLLVEIEEFTEQSLMTAEEHEKFGLMIMSIMTVVAAVGGLLISIFLVRRSINPILGVVPVLDALAAGDTTVSLVAHSDDEVGQIARSVRNLTEKLIAAEQQRAAQAAEEESKVKRAEAIDQMIVEFDQTASSALDTVASAATEMQSTSESMSATAEQTTQQAGSVASASE